MSSMNQEKSQKPKITSSLSISQLLQEVKRKKMLTKSLKLSFQAKNKKKKRKKFPSIVSGKERNLKLTPKSTPKSKTKNFSVQSILKKQVKTSPIEKHVTFSDNDAIFEREDLSSSPVELRSVRRTECAADEEQESVKDSDKGAEEPQITTVSNELGIDNEKENSQQKCVDLNKMLDTCIVHEDSARGGPEMVENMREPSISCLVDKDQISHADHSVALPGTNISNRSLLSFSSSTGSNKSSSANTHLNNDCFSNLCCPEEFIGLPLNSQGELAINPKPNLIPNSREFFNRNEMLPGPSGGVLLSGSVPVPVPAPLPVGPIGMVSPESDVRMRPLYFKDKFGMEHYYTPLMPVRPGFGFMQLPGFERMEIQSYDPLLDHTIMPTNIYEIGKKNAEPTVRLMGKNVSLGRSSKDCIGWNRSVWVDKGNVTLNGGNFPFSRERKQGLSFSVEPRFNKPQGQVYSHAGITFSSGHGSHPMPHLNPVSTNYNSFTYQQPSVNQQVLLDSTHCKHSQSRSISFASPPCRGEAPRWIQNPRSKTHKPSFPSYINPSTTQKQPHIVYGNTPNLPSSYPATVISFPAYNPGNICSHTLPCMSIPPLNSTFIPPYLTARPDFASNDKGQMQNNPKFHLLRPDYINQNNKRPLERDDLLARSPVKKPFQSDLGSITKSTGPGTIRRREEILDFGMRADKAVNTEASNTKLYELGTGGFLGPVSDFVVRSGPVKLSAGARHVLTPGPNLDRVNPRPILSMMPLISGSSLRQKSTEEIY
jgi:hypothetical protein